jgi:hypothetical protein
LKRARALADPAEPTRLRPGYDSGDHLHPSTEGRRMMASVAAGVLREKEFPTLTEKLL